MDKAEIKKLIEDEKKMLAEFQKIAKEYQISEDIAQKQIDFYLDTLNKLYELQKKLNDEK